jgi:carboxyl-terminal processing protease
MKSTRLLLTLLGVLVSCAPRPSLAGTPTALPSATATVRRVESSLTPTASPTLLPNPATVTAGPASPTPRADATPPPTIDAATRARHLRIFEQLWNTVNTQYVYTDFNGVNWSAAHSEFKARIESGLSDEDFWRAMAQMIDRLGDDHSAFLAPSEAHEQDDELQGKLAYVGIGIYADAQTAQQRAILLAVFPGGPAEQAGLRAHDAILAIDGRPVVNPDGTDNLDRLRGEPGTPVALRVKSPGETPRDVSVIRHEVGGTLRVTGRLLPSDPVGERIGYLWIPTLWDTAIESGVRDTLTDLMNGGRLDGLIIDLRINGGGVSTNLLALLAYFTDGERGKFVGRSENRPLRVTANPIGNSQAVPLVILVSEFTESYAEVFSGVLREAGRARIVGRTTAGNIETIYGYNFEDGSRAWIARETFVPPSGARWEHTGIIPDVPVDVGWDEFTEKNDADLATALKLLSRSIGASLP